MITIRRILVPTDFGECSAPAVRFAAELADKFGAELSCCTSCRTSLSRCPTR